MPLRRAVSLIGVSVGLLSACTQQGTKVVTEKQEKTAGDMAVREPAAGCDSMVVGKVAVPEDPDTTEVFGDIAEQMPMFPGGDRQLMKYLASSIQYPPAQSPSARADGVCRLRRV